MRAAAARPCTAHDARVTRGALALRSAETIFPLEGAGGLARLRNIDYKSCELGLKVKPMKAGDALLFYNIHPNSTFDKARGRGAAQWRGADDHALTRRPCGARSMRCTAAAP